MRDRLLELRDAFSQTVFGPLVPEKAALQERVIRVGILCVAAGEPLPLFLGERERERARDLIGDRVLDREQVGQLLVEVSGPQHRPVVDADDMHGDANAAGRSLDGAVQHDVHVELAGGRQRIGWTLLISQHGGCGSHRDAANASELRDQRVGNAEADVLFTGGKAERREGEYRKRQQGAGRADRARVFPRSQVLEAAPAVPRHRRHETIAEARNRDHVAMLVRPFAERFSQHEHGLRQVAFLDARVGPDAT